MDVTAYDTVSNAPILLGAIAEQIWVNGFRSGSERELQPFKPFRGSSVVVFDRVTVGEDFSFAAGRTFPQPNAVGKALIFLATHRAAVPHLAHLLFSADSSSVWLVACGIRRIELMQKTSALVVFGYHLQGGAWSLTKPF
jgi:hypothetical protein